MNGFVENLNNSFLIDRDFITSVDLKDLDKCINEENPNIFVAEDYLRFSKRNSNLNSFRRYFPEISDLDPKYGYVQENPFHEYNFNNEVLVERDDLSIIKIIEKGDSALRKRG